MAAYCHGLISDYSALTFVHILELTLNITYYKVYFNPPTDIIQHTYTPCFLATGGYTTGISSYYCMQYCWLVHFHIHYTTFHHFSSPEIYKAHHCIVAAFSRHGPINDVFTSSAFHLKDHVPLCLCELYSLQL